MKKVTIIVSSLLVFACGGAKIITISQADVTRAAIKYPGIT